MFASAGRRGATVGYTALKENAAWISPLLAVSSGFEKWDVRDAVNLAGKEIDEAKANAQVSVIKFLSGKRIRGGLQESLLVCDFCPF